MKYTLPFYLFFSICYSQSSRLIFEYDNSGNQKLREIQAKVSRISSFTTLERPFTKEEKQISIYPNPVDSEFTISWESELSPQLLKIELVPYNGNFIQTIKFKETERKTLVNMSGRAAGVYYVKVYLLDGRKLYYSLIKI